MVSLLLKLLLGHLTDLQQTLQVVSIDRIYQKLSTYVTPAGAIHFGASP